MTAPGNDWAELAAVAAEHDAITEGLGRWTEAVYGGWCRGCGYTYEPGSLIRFDEGEGEWICWDCGTAA